MPLHFLCGIYASSTMKSDPRWWEWEKIPKMETDVLTVTDPLEREATRHKWEGKTWKSVPRRMKHTPGRPAYRVKRYLPKVYRKK